MTLLHGGFVLGCYSRPLCSQPTKPNSTRKVLRVGLNRDIKTIADCAYLARAGDTIEVDSGVYPADVAVWEHDHVTVRAAHGRGVVPMSSLIRRSTLEDVFLRLTGRTLVD